ncbi:hypothetical protein PoB_003070300 [Plakobranchus ocellatus]|uniref:Uncharacterized protein n=1 Tax=Plakobranchus ocellatus TaxID=259542 RepID=A0AAV4ACC8_9GAST|nr:hypothetical protein PoB_003070300 [Plakobranchus ocellatus]
MRDEWTLVIFLNVRLVLVSSAAVRTLRVQEDQEIDKDWTFGHHSYQPEILEKKYTEKQAWSRHRKGLSVQYGRRHCYPGSEIIPGSWGSPREEREEDFKDDLSTLFITKEVTLKVMSLDPSCMRKI